MLKKLLLLFFVLSFSSPAFAAWRFNPHTGKPDYYEATGELLDGDKGEVVVSSGVWSLENAAVIGKLITGFSSGAGALAGTDTILQAINKLDGNIGTKQAAGSYEVTTNKENTTIDTSTTKYPTVNLLKTGLDAKAATAQTFYIGTTQVAINRGSGALTLAGITLTTPEIGEATGTSLHLTTLLTDHIGEHTGSHKIVFDNIISTTSNIQSMPHQLKFTIIDPPGAYAKSTIIPLWVKTDAALTITNIEFRCDADPTTEVTGDIKYADDLIGLANATVINDIDTTAGTRSDSSITSATVAAGKSIYLSYDTTPDAATKFHSGTITFDYD